MFESYDAAKYRTLSEEGFEARFAEIKGLMEAEELPEGVTDEMLYAEADLIKAENERRAKRNAFAGIKLTKAQIEERNDKAQAVLAGEGNVIDSTQKVEQKRSGFKAVSETPYANTTEYRTALAQHISRQAPMPTEMIQRARAEYLRTGDPISVTVADGYSNYTDPTGVALLGSVPMPVNFIQEVARELKNYGGLDQKVSRTNFQGGVAVSEAELVGSAAWISDKQVAPWNPDDFETFTFSAWQVEYRIARSLLAQAVMTDNYTNVAPAAANEISRVLNSAIWNGDGNGKPTGIIADSRLINASTGKGTIVEVTSADMADWAFWASVQYNLNSAYRGRGEWIMADSTWAKYVSVLRDDNNRPIANFMGTYSALNETYTPSIGTRPVNLLDDSIADGFDAASDGDIFAVFGDPKCYTLNTQPGMPLTTISWDDHDNNLHKTKISMAADGRVTNPFGWLLLKKKASA